MATQSNQPPHDPSESAPTLLITGANGYTGTQFCRILADAGHRVRGMVYAPDGAAPDVPGVEFVAGDVRNRDDLRRALAGIDTIFHLAALYRPVNVRKRDYLDVNVDGTRNLLEVAAETGSKRIVHCSTIGVHGHIADPPANEDAPIKPDDYYQHTKYEGEMVARTRGTELGHAVTVIRPAAIYGPHERRFLKLAQLIAKRRFMMFGSGAVPYHFVHVTDLARAFVRCVETPESVGGIYIIADDHAITLNDILEIVSGALGVSAPHRRWPLGLLLTASTLCEWGCRPFGIPPPLHRRRAEWFWSARSFDISRARRELHYDPQVDVSDGLRDMVQSYRAAGWL